jgi:uncharacterized protein YecE (DUF72 family)
VARAKRARAGRICVGTSGWVYRSWREHLYRGLPMRAWLAHASSVFDSLEINGSFYTQISRETYRRWRSETPRGFRFALKGHRFVTHYKRLRDVDRSIALLRDAASALGDKLAVVVWQLPASFPADPERLRGFVQSLDGWSTVRHAIELRHRSWFTDEVADILVRARVASCISDAPDFPLWRAVTTDLVYVRLHGHTRKYASSYTRPHLRRWAADANAWAREVRDVYVYFDNDAEGAAVRNALTLLEELGAGRGRTARANSSAPRVFSTSALRTRARRAIPTASSR